MIRRMKRDVLSELPDKTHSVIPLDISNRKEYNEAFYDFESYYVDKILAELNDVGKNIKAQKGKSKMLTKQLDLFDDIISKEVKDSIINMTLDKLLSAEHLMKINSLRQLVSEGKMKYFLDWLKDFITGGDKKIVVFGEHRKTLSRIQKAFPKISVVVDGSVKDYKRQEAVDQFQNDPEIRIFIGNKAAQEGLTLTAASRVAHIEFPWNPGSIDQRNDRCHRIGQKDNVECYYFIAVNTIDEKLAEIIDFKRSIADKALDGINTNPVQILTKLLTTLKSKK
jgi:SWI/SNF-related matrix-associated actin-dependent regulator 1 of chromatin subfamily A